MGCWASAGCAWSQRALNLWGFSVLAVLCPTSEQTMYIWTGMNQTFINYPAGRSAAP